MLSLQGKFFDGVGFYRGKTPQRRRGGKCNFLSGQGGVPQEYPVYFKAPQRRRGGKF